MKMVNDATKKPYHAKEKVDLTVKSASNFKPSGGLKGKGKSFKGKPAKAGAFKYREGM